MNARAVGYLLKDASRDEVIDALQRFAAGEEALNSASAPGCCDARPNATPTVQYRPKT